MTNSFEVTNCLDPFNSIGILSLALFGQQVRGHMDRETRGIVTSIAGFIAILVGCELFPGCLRQVGQ